MIPIIDIYENYSASEYYDAVQKASAQASEAVYYLLRRRLSRALRHLFKLHGFGLDDHFDDTIDDFFLYLYDRGDARPFSIFDSVREKEAFFGWMVGTYRNFLLNKAKEELKRKEMMENASVAIGEGRSLSDETLMRYIATAIAYEDQELTPRNRFIFYRMLLTLLDPKAALSQEQVAKAMGMHPVTYRVCVNRLRMRLSAVVGNLEQGQVLPLDSGHRLMSHRILQGFDHLYDRLMPYYEATLQSLSSAAEIKALRAAMEHDGIVMHETLDYYYQRVVEVRRLYDSLKS